jgi:hypothetical protein
MESYKRIIDHTREEWDGRMSPRSPRNERRGQDTARSMTSVQSPCLSPRHNLDQENQRREGPAWLSSVLYYQNQSRTGASTPISVNDAAEVLPGLMTPRSTTSESRRIEEVSARLKALKDRVEGLDDSSRRNSPRPVRIQPFSVPCKINDFTPADRRRKHLRQPALTRARSKRD